MKIIKVRVSDEETDAFAAEKMPHVKKAIASAKSVLSIFEKEYLGDKRPRKAIEAAEAWVKNPTERNKENAGAAGINAGSAAYAASVSRAAEAASAAFAASTAAAAASRAAFESASVAASRAAKFASKAKSASR